MNKQTMEVGSKYLTLKGIPVTLLEVRDNKRIVRVETTGNKLELTADYKLLPYEESKIAHDAKVLLKANGKSKNGKVPAARDGSLTAIIGPMLASGRFTVKEIAAEIKKKAAALCVGKDLEANVRAACYSAKRRGWKVERDAQKRIKVIAKKAA